jgi:hypothetical protein
LKHIDDHETLFAKVFSDEIPDDLEIFDSRDHYTLEELNPTDAIEVAEFSSEVENWTTWVLHSYFYVCKVPGHSDTYLLFSISWDDNWEQWERQSWGAVKGPKTHESASAVLLKRFAEENVENADDGDWKKFLTKFLG